MSRALSSTERRSRGTDELVEALLALTEEVRVLRQAVDDLRTEVQYGTRNLLGEASHARSPGPAQ